MPLFWDVVAISFYILYLHVIYRFLYCFIFSICMLYVLCYILDFACYISFVVLCYILYLHFPIVILCYILYLHVICPLLYCVIFYIYIKLDFVYNKFNFLKVTFHCEQSFFSLNPNKLKIYNQNYKTEMS